jgi:hypothetical protein
VWNYGHVSNPVSVSGSVENPANSEAFFLHPPALFFGLRPDPAFYQEGQNFGGLVYARRIADPLTTMVALVRQLRTNAARLQIVGGREMPDLAKALQVPVSKNQKGIGLRVTYEFQGGPVDEEFYGVFDSVEIPYDGPQGRTFQDNWGLTAVHSFRAPRGTLDGRREVFTAIAKSFRPNPAWQQRLAAIGAYLGEEFNRQLQAGYDLIAAAGQLSRQISANNDAMIAAIDQRLEAVRATTPPPQAGARSAADKFDDYVRGVDTVDDPYYGRSQHASTEKYHWTDGYGSYRNSNDPHFDPRNTESGDWQLMPASR